MRVKVLVTPPRSEWGASQQTVMELKSGVMQRNKSQPLGRTTSCIGVRFSKLRPTTEDDWLWGGLPEPPLAVLHWVPL
jgi:hypothetical protein